MFNFLAHCVYFTIKVKPNKKCSEHRFCKYYDYQRHIWYSQNKNIATFNAIYFFFCKSYIHYKRLYDNICLLWTFFKAAWWKSFYPAKKHINILLLIDFVFMFTKEEKPLKNLVSKNRRFLFANELTIANNSKDEHLWKNDQKTKCRKKST